MTAEVSARETYFEARNLLMEAITAFDFLQQETKSINYGLGHEHSCPADYKTELWTALDNVYRHTVVKLNMCIVRLFEGTKFTAELSEDGMEVILPYTEYYTCKKRGMRPVLSVLHMKFNGYDILESHSTCLALYNKITREGWPKHALNYLYHYFDTHRIRADYVDSARHAYRLYTPRRSV